MLRFGPESEPNDDLIGDSEKQKADRPSGTLGSDLDSWRELFFCYDTPLNPTLLLPKLLPKQQKRVTIKW
jgi:hypothetical protein